ncbi:helix-turn-helix domain-containing protein [Sciscionella marina]|uniref:helix-turn-helix domain-containing protein n=1 Tax=Sciscionella marina TaxID=508770 RepID=UPI0006841029|nr:helix-turn-helix transcriptional regulator [Sciscionella marina]
MPRPEKPLDVQSGPLAQFAADLRELRHTAGGPTYRAMARRANYSPGALSQAAAGSKLPSFAVLRAYVQACDGDVDQWSQRWNDLAETLGPRQNGAGERDAAERHATEHDAAGAEDSARPAGQRRPRALLLLVGLLCVAVLVLVALLLWPASPTRPSDLDHDEFTATAGRPGAGAPPPDAHCSSATSARGCFDPAGRRFWVKDEPPADGHHPAVYWITGGDTAHGDCHAAGNSASPWYTCPYPAAGKLPTVIFQVANVEQNKVLVWGPDVTVPPS